MVPDIGGAAFNETGLQSNDFDEAWCIDRKERALAIDAVLK